MYIYGEPKIGSNVWIGPFVVLDASSGLEIGDYCDINIGVQIYIHSTHLRCLSSGRMDIVRKKVTVEKNVYTGSQSVILPGVAIGHHSVVGEASLVNKPVKSHSAVAGVPARRIGIVKRGKNGTATLVNKKP